MKISTISSYIETLQFTSDVLFDDALNINDIFKGLNNAIDKIGVLDISLLMEESMQPEVGTIWKKLMGINQMKCERLNKIPFSELTLEKLKDRVNVIYERFPLIQRIDNMSEGAHGSVMDLILTDCELVKLLLDPNVDGSNLTFTKCKDVVDMFMDKQIEFQNLHSEIKQQSNIQGQMEKEIQSQTSTESDSPILPDELATPDAMKIWDKAKKAGWINDDYSFKGTKYQMAYAAEIMGQALGLKHKWKPFIILWKYKYFSQTRHESIERFGKVERDRDIEKSFSL